MRDGRSNLCNGCGLSGALSPRTHRLGGSVSRARGSQRSRWVSSTYADRHSSCGEIRRVLAPTGSTGDRDCAFARRIEQARSGGTCAGSSATMPACPPRRRRPCTTSCSTGSGSTPGPSSLRRRLHQAPAASRPRPRARAVRVARPCDRGGRPNGRSGRRLSNARQPAQGSSSSASAVRIGHLCQHTEPATGVAHRRKARTATFRCLGGEMFRPKAVSVR